MSLTDSTTDTAGLPAIRTRAKFYVSGLKLQPGTQNVEVTLAAVCRGDRNSDWASATPSGSITMMINNPVAAAQWERFVQASRSTGKQPELYVDFGPSEDGWPGDGHPFRAGEGQDGTAYDSRYCGECGLAKDADLTEYDNVTRTSTVIGKAHPQG